MITPKKLLVYKIRAEMKVMKLHAQREAVVAAERGKQKPAQPVAPEVAPQDNAQAMMGGPNA
jgi:hypothetical protein